MAEGISEWAVRCPFTKREASTQQKPDLPGDLARKFMYETRFADTRLADHGDEVRTALVNHPGERRSERREVPIAADERRVQMKVL